MRQNKIKIDNGDLKIRAITARMKLREAGINYGVVIRSRHPQMDSIEAMAKVRAVANGSSTDIQITQWLEELVLEQTQKQSA